MSSSETPKYIDKYEVIGEVGRGAMGEVYKALHPQFRKYVAIKEINLELAGEAEVRRRFEEEAELLARIPPHPNIVMVRDAFVWLGQLYLVMDYVEGGTLKDLLVDGVGVERGVQLLDQIMSALEAIHRSAIVHMDLKPANILIDREGIPHLSDFGVAECVGSKKRDRLWGTAKYVAPELIDPLLGCGAVAQQADIYSLGIIAYEMLLGKRRFCVEFGEVYNNRAEDHVEEWIAWHTDLARAPRNLNDIDPSIPRAIANLVESMMAKDVNARQRNVSDARRDLVAWFATARDMRGRRGGPPRDEATVPLDQLRGGGARPPRESQRLPATPKSGPLFNRERASREPPVMDPSPTPAPRRVGGGLPKWAWWAGLGAVLLFVMAVALPPLLVASPGFTMKVIGAPPGSDVWVDDKRVGIPVNDGTIKAFGMLPGEGRKVLVRCQGCEDFAGSISGKDGQEVEFPAGGMKCNGEITYRGSTMILISEGAFLMGDDNNDADEKPRHSINVDAFYIDKYEVKNEEYRRFCEATGLHYPPTGHPWYQDYFTDPKLPVMGVSWTEAQKYAKWAGKRLPTEEEWEKAASWGPGANKKRMWPWGDDPTPQRARLGDQKGYPAAVDSYPEGVSAYGVFNMAGNVAEWVGESYTRYPENTEPPPSDYPYGNETKVARGGSVFSAINQARTTYRDPQPPDIKPTYLPDQRLTTTTFGIRCAVSANHPEVVDIVRKRQSAR